MCMWGGGRGGEGRESPFVLPVMRFLCFIGLDTADIMRSAHHQLPYQLIGLRLYREVEYKSAYKAKG